VGLFTTVFVRCQAVVHPPAVGRRGAAWDVGVGISSLHIAPTGGAQCYICELMIKKMEYRRSFSHDGHHPP
jgi:hypothetical protein